MNEDREESLPPQRTPTEQVASDSSLPALHELPASSRFSALSHPDNDSGFDACSEDTDSEDDDSEDAELEDAGSKDADAEDAVLGDAGSEGAGLGDAESEEADSEDSGTQRLMDSEADASTPPRRLVVNETVKPKSSLRPEAVPFVYGPSIHNPQLHPAPLQSQELHFQCENPPPQAPQQYYKDARQTLASENRIPEYGNTQHGSHPVQIPQPVHLMPQTQTVPDPRYFPSCPQPQMTIPRDSPGFGHDLDQAWVPRPDLTPAYDEPNHLALSCADQGNSLQAPAPNPTVADQNNPSLVPYYSPYPPVIYPPPQDIANVGLPYYQMDGPRVDTQHNYPPNAMGGRERPPLPDVEDCEAPTEAERKEYGQQAVYRLNRWKEVHNPSKDTASNSDDLVTCNICIVALPTSSYPHPNELPPYCRNHESPTCGSCLRQYVSTQLSVVGEEFLVAPVNCPSCHQSWLHEKEVVRGLVSKEEYSAWGSVRPVYYISSDSEEDVSKGEVATSNVHDSGGDAGVGMSGGGFPTSNVRKSGDESS